MIALLCGCAAALTLSCANDSSESLPPNIVLIIIDTLRADRLGSYGYPLDTSPELDAYAERGVRFDFVLAPSTWTRPAIASILTSLHPRTLGLYNELEEILASHFDTLPEILRENGYTTLGVTANPNINSHFNFHQGFDRYIDSDVVMEWMTAAADEGIRGESGRWLSEAGDVLDTTRDALATMGNPPFYAQVDLMDVHEFHDLRVPLEDTFADTFPAELGLTERRYLGAIRVVSREIDRFISELTVSRGWENTLFVITSDHGETIADHPQLADPKWHGYLVYESQARVPLIFFSPNGAVPEGRVVDRPVRLLDLLPTLLDYAGIPAPDGIEGVSLRPLIEDPSASAGLPDAIVVESRFREARKLAVYTDTWKYIENRDEHGGTNPRALQPVGVSEDGSRTDVADQHPDEVERLAEFLRRWELAHPSVEPSFADGEIPDAVSDQLRALGYAD